MRARFVTVITDRLPIPATNIAYQRNTLLNFSIQTIIRSGCHDTGVVMPQEKATFHSKDPTSALSDKSVALDINTPSIEEAAPSTKASFYARDPGAEINDPLAIEDGDSSPIKEKYMGMERRRGNRREAKDRRTDVRFDLTNSDRREAQGRRKDDLTPKFW
jgi:hypothetical protein